MKLESHKVVRAMSIHSSNVARSMAVIVASLLLALTSQNAWAQKNTKIESKAIIDEVISQIDRDAGVRADARLQRGEALGVTKYDDEEGPIVSLQENAFYFGVDNCNNVDEFDNWNFLFFPFKVNTEIDKDVRSPAKNLKFAIKKNAYVAKKGTSTRCYSHAEFNHKKIYKVTANKVVGSKKRWEFEKKFKEDADYYRVNKPEARIKNLPKNSVICNTSARLCYNNKRGLNFFSRLTTTGIPPLERESVKENNFYLQTRNTLRGVSEKFPKLKLQEVTRSESYIAKYVSDNLKNTIIVSARDNAMGRFAAEDISALKDVGIDLSNLEIRGAHVSIITPGKSPINETNNNGMVSVDSKRHNVPHLGLVMSAGFAHGDHSVINVRGSNVSTNYRGLNIVILDSKGKVVSSKNFDTHTSSYRTQGLYEASLE